MASKNQRLQQLDEWIFQTKLSSKKERKKALEDAGVGSDLYEYYKNLIHRNKPKNIQKPKILLFHY